MLKKLSSREITWLSWSPFLKCFLSTRERKAGVFKFLRSEGRFRKSPFSWRISVDGRPNRRNKAAFSNSSAVLWTGPKTRCIRKFQINIYTILDSSLLPIKTLYSMPLILAWIQPCGLLEWIQLKQSKHCWPRKGKLSNVLLKINDFHNETA